MNSTPKKSKKSEIIWTVILVLLFVLLNIAIKTLHKVNLSMFKGVLASFQYGICLLLLRTNYKSGSKISIILMAIDIIEVFIDISMGAPSSLPGLFNGIFYFITIILIAQYNYKREKENKTDFITGAFNRKGLYLELENRILKNKEFSIIYIHLDNFKAINDGYGHAFGDELLRKTVKRMTLRFGQECTIARLGGAEFGVIVNADKNVKNIADRLLETIGEKVILVADNNHIDCYVTCYAGVARFPKDASDYESLIKYADIAMTTAMAAKSKEAFIFDEVMLEKMNRQIHVEKLMKDGLVKNFFYLMYQPQYEAATKKLRGFETLIRLKTDTDEIIHPHEFIPIAEMNDVIFHIDNYVLINAMTEFKDIIIQNPELSLSINVSAKDFANPAFVEKIQRMLKTTQFPPKNLELEITEYCIVSSMEVTFDNINKLREYGVQIALDDFGTGYTSLDYVSRLPIDLLKIDKSLIDDIENNKKRSDFVHAVINMGHLMNCKVISEGVENEKQINCLKDYGCDYIQGFVWNKPMLYNDIKKLLLQ